MTRIHVRQRGKAYIFILLILLVIGSLIIGIETFRKRAAKPNQEIETPSRYSSVGTQDEFPRELYDGGGQRLWIKSRPQRIVSQTLGTDEILLAICEPERIVAFSKFALDPEYSNILESERVRNTPQVSNTEDILTLNPDIIFIASYSRAEVGEQLQATGAPVFRFASFDNIDNIKSNIRKIGYATGNDERAADLVAEMERRLEVSRARIVSGRVPPRVMSYSTLGSTAGSDTLFDDIIRQAGAINVAAEKGLKGFQQISVEQITEWQPDFIIVGASAVQTEEFRRQLLSNPGIAATKAARSGRLIIMDNRYFLAVSQHVVDAVDELVKKLYETPPASAK